MAKSNFVDFTSTLQQRQVLEGFQLYLAEQSPLLARYFANGASTFGTNNKLEWLESKLAPTTWTVNGQITAGTLSAGTPANITFTSTTGLTADKVIEFESSTGAPLGNLQVRITSVTNGTVAQWVIYGGTTDITIPTAYVAKTIANLVAEWNKTFTATNDWEPTQEYNYFQLFEDSLTLSGTALNSIMYGDPNNVANQMKSLYFKMYNQMIKSAMGGVRIARSSTEKGSMAGLDFYLNQAGGNIKDASSSAITATMINDVNELIFRQGGQANTIVCNTNQARKIGAFNTSGTNPVLFRDASNTTTGTYTNRFISDIQAPNGQPYEIIVDPNVKKDRVYIIDTNEIALVPYQNGALSLMDGTLPAQHGITMVLRGEYTLQVRDGRNCLGVIKNLTL